MGEEKYEHFIQKGYGISFEVLERGKILADFEKRGGGGLKVQ